MSRNKVFPMKYLLNQQSSEDLPPKIGCNKYSVLSFGTLHTCDYWPRQRNLVTISIRCMEHTVHHEVTPEVALEVAQKKRPALKDVAELVARFDEDVCEAAKFKNAMALETAWRTRMECNGVSREDENTEGCARVEITNRAPMDEIYFFCDPHEPGAVIGVPNKRMADNLEHNGWKKATLTYYHHGVDITALRPSIPTSSVEPARPVSPSPLIPEVIKIPDKVPPISKKACAPCAAEQVVRMFEEPISVKGDQYSPIWKWNADARKKMGEKKVDTSSFRERCLVYWYICEHDCRLPSSIDASYSELRSAASKLSKENETDLDKSFEKAVKAYHKRDRRAASASV